jgi:hypothetical protein
MVTFKVPKKLAEVLFYFCVFSILLFQGMLFTQINTDDFQLAAGSLLDQFRVLIAKSPLPLSADRLVQIMALNMYSIEVSTCTTKYIHIQSTTVYVPSSELGLSHPHSRERMFPPP